MLICGSILSKISIKISSKIRLFLFFLMGSLCVFFKGCNPLVLGISKILKVNISCFWFNVEICLPLIMPSCIFYPMGVKESFKKSRPLISFPTYLINRLGWVLFILFMIRFLIPNTVYSFFFLGSIMIKINDCCLIILMGSIKCFSPLKYWDFKGF